jgi:glycosyltransferase involved in cell wall biosynthesis
MKITVVYQYFQDQGEPGHSVVYELTHYLAQQGHDVSVVTGEMGYMKRRPAFLRPWYFRMLRREQDGAVSIVRTYTYPELHRNYLTRLLSFASFSVSCLVGIFSIRKTDVLLASSPPIFPMFFTGLVCKIRKIPFVFEVRDLWPESAIQMGILQSRWQIKIMARMEKWLYDHSRRIVALTPGVKEDICRRGWRGGKVVFIPCGIDSEKMYPDADGGATIRRRHGWQDKKIILYFGALGEANNLPVMLKAAERLQERVDAIFVMIGDGMKRPAIEEMRKTMGLDNVRIMAPVPKQEARSYISAADLCLVTLQDIPVFEGAIPTKLLEYLACGRPVVCGIRGEAEQIIRDSRAGVVFEPNDDRRLAQLISELIADDERTHSLAAMGPAYIERHFAASAIHKRMENTLLKAAGLKSKWPV